MKKTALITGASRGIGAATAAAFAREGYRVVINYLTQHEAAAKLKAKLEAEGAEVMTISADVSDKAQVDAMIRQIEETFGTVDVLVNNAGIAIPLTRLEDYPEENWDRIFNTNIKSMYNCTKAVLPGMIAKKSGAIVNVSSIWGITGGCEEVPYSATKGAVVLMTRSLAKEVGPDGIRVNCVAPGVIETDMNAWQTPESRAVIYAATPLRRFGQPEEIAEAILFLGSDRASFITGQVLSPNGGYVI